MTGKTKGATAREIRFSRLELTPRFEYGDMAKVAPVIGSDDGTELGAGFGRMINAVIPWTVKYDEIILVVEGEVTIETASGNLVAGPKDCVWLPKGTELVYRADDALLFFAIHPANWAEAAT